MYVYKESILRNVTFLFLRNRAQTPLHLLLPLRPDPVPEARPSPNNIHKVQTFVHRTEDPVEKGLFILRIEVSLILD